MAQDVAELVPRVRRALEGAKPLDSSDPEFLTEDQVKALVADTIADLILLTEGGWGHALVPQGVPPYDEWEVDPALTPQEESLVSAQAALTHFFHVFRDQKVSERIKNESQEWEWTRSASMVREIFKLLKEQRDAALNAMLGQSPVLAQYQSILAVRDSLAAARLEPWLSGGLRGGMELIG